VSVELVHSEPSPDVEQRLFRVMADVSVLQQRLSRAEIRTLYAAIERTRDALSRLLDYADGKDA
jgi:flagellar biosynthesis/type III secretory pathway ATPase